MNKFRLLRADEIECRIAQVKPKGLSLLLYKTARTDANLLDETVGPENWENDFKTVDGVLYGGIGIYNEAKDRWIWKWDAGTESNTEAEKGRASDAFKRAGFKHGIGRELYTAPFIWIPADKCKIDNGKCYDKFEVKVIDYNDAAEIVTLVIYNQNGEVVYTKGRQTKPVNAPKQVEYADSEQVAYIVTQTTPEQLEAVMKKYNLKNIEDITIEQAKKTIMAINKQKMKEKENG